MRLSEIMSAAGLSIFPQIALLIFLAVFAAITCRLCARRRGDPHSTWAALPLDDGDIAVAEHDRKGRS